MEWEKDPRNPKNRENRLPPGAAAPPRWTGRPGVRPRRGTTLPRLAQAGAARAGAARARIRSWPLPSWQA